MKYYYDLLTGIEYKVLDDGTMIRNDRACCIDEAIEQDDEC